MASKNFLVKIPLFLVFLTVLAVVSVGSGFEIYDWYDLDEVRTDLSGEYYLMNDLDETSPGYDDVIDEAGFTPIGSEEYPFTGVLDGQNHTIRDFESTGMFEFIDDGEVVNISFEEFEFDVGNDGSVVSRKSRQSFFENIEIRDSNLSGNSRVGFISAVDKNSIFEEISVEDSNISCYERCGSLVGKGKQLLVFNNNVSNVDVTGNLIAGGLVGQGFGEFGDNIITDVYVDAQIGVGGVIGDATSFDFEDQWIDRTHFVYTRFWDTFLENVHLNNTHHGYDEEDLNRIESLDSELNRGGFVGMNYRSSDFEFEVSNAYMNIEFDEWVEDDGDGHWASMVGVIAGDQEFQPSSSGEIDIDIDTVITNNLQIVDSNSGLLFHKIVDKFDEELHWSLRVEDVLAIDTMPDGNYRSDYITIGDHYRGYFDDFNVSNSYINRDNMDYITTFIKEDFTVGTTDDLTYPYSAGFYTEWDFETVWEDGYNNVFSDFNDNQNYPFLRYFFEVEELSVDMVEVNVLSDTEAEFVGEVTDFGGYDSVYAGFEYRESGETEWVNASVEEVFPGEPVFSHVETGLEPGTDYEVRAVVEMEGDVEVSGLLSFSTFDPEVFEVEMDSVVNVLDTEAEFVGEVTGFGGYDSVYAGFEYRESGETEWSDTVMQEVFPVSPVFSHVETGLEEDTSYEVRAFMVKEGDEAFSDVLTFTTLSEDDVVVPPVDEVMEDFAMFDWVSPKPGDGVLEHMADRYGFRAEVVSDLEDAFCTVDITVYELDAYGEKDVPIYTNRFEDGCTVMGEVETPFVIEEVLNREKGDYWVEYELEAEENDSVVDSDRIEGVFRYGNWVDYLAGLVGMDFENFRLLLGVFIMLTGSVLLYVFTSSSEMAMGGYIGFTSIFLYIGWFSGFIGFILASSILIGFVLLRD